MRASNIIFSLLALSLSDAAVVNRRDLKRRDVQTVQEDVTVVEKVEVIKHQDGSLTIGTPVIVNTVRGTSTPVPPAPEVHPAPKNEPQPQQEPKPVNDDHAVSTLSQPDHEEKESSSQEPPKTEPAQEHPISEHVQDPQVEAAPQDIPKDEAYQGPNPAEFATKSAELTTTLKEEKYLSKSTSSGKRGIAYNDPLKLKAFTSSSEVSWAYNWGDSAAQVPQNMEYVPMLWGLGSHSTGWHEAAEKALKQGCRHFLAFNEPDLGEQSSLTVGQAVEGYKAHMQPYAGRAKLGSPAVTNGGAPMGLAYLTEFVVQCTGCTIDFVAIHWYNGGTAADFKNHVLKAHLCSGKPVWVTEFQGPGDQSQQQEFLRQVIPWLDRQNYVERYAYFMASDGNLISSGTTLSPVGQAFAYIS